MPSHGSVTQINKVHRRATGRTPSVRVGSRTTPPSTQPRTTTTRVGRQAQSYSPQIRQHSRSVNQAQKLSDALSRVQRVYAQPGGATGVSGGVKAFADALARRTGLSPHVTAAWATEEGGHGGSDFNLLNIATGLDAGFNNRSEFSSPKGAASATAKFLKGKSYGASQGIKNILPQARGAGDQKQLNAIAGSGWATDPAYRSKLQGTYSRTGEKPTKAPNPQDVHKLQKAGINPSGEHGAAKKKASPVKTAKQFKGHYVNPYGAPTEVDQGVDYGGSGDIRTIGKAKVVDTGNSSFGGGPFLAYQLQDGPRKGWTVYVAEGVQARSGLKAGQTLPKGAVFAHQSSGIETGWAAKPGTPYRSGQTLSAATGDTAGIASRHSNFTATPSSSDPVAGRDFLKFLQGKPGLKVTNVGGASGGASGVTFTSSAGVSSFTNATGMTPKQAQHMSPRQRLMALHTALNKTLRGYGGAAAALPGGGSSSASSSSKLSRAHGSPVV